MVPAEVLPQEPRQGSLQVKRMLGRLASLAVKMDNQVCAIADMPIPFPGCGSEEINSIK